MKKDANKSSNAAKLRRHAKGRQESNKQYRMLFDNAGDAIFIHDVKGQILAANTMACKQYGYTQAEMLSMNVNLLVIPEKRIHVKKRLARMIKKGCLKFEAVHQCKDRTPLNMEVNSRRITWNGQAAIMSICHDLTEQRKLTEELYRKSEELQIIFDSNPAMIFFKDANNRMIRINKAFAAASNISKKKTERKNASKLYPHQDEHYWADDKQVMATGKPMIGIVEPLQTPNGVKWMQTDKVPYRDKDGRIAGVIGFALDITERKKMEDALRKSEERFRGIANNLPGMVYQFYARSNGEWSGSFIDQRAKELYGIDVEPLATFYERFTARIAPEDRARWIASIQDAVRNVALWNFEGKFIKLTGEAVFIRGLSQPVKMKDEVVFNGIILDITDLKRAQDEREWLNQELNRKNQELETLIRITSHDLRSPLVNIQGFNQLLNKAYDVINRIMTDAVLPDETRQALVASHKKAEKAMGFINAGVEKMNGLINGLLRLSQLGRAPLTFQPLDMNALLQTVVEAMAFQIQTVAAEVAVDALPDCRADAALINQVFSNLLENAIKYRDSARPLRVRVWGRHPGWSHREKDARMVYCVEDNGLGVAPEHRQKIWDLFYRPNPQGSSAGEGIGLTVVQRVVERHGGKVWLESETGKGSRFFLTLPAAAKETKL